ncbi:Tether containing UBX domain for GLUT4 [Cichlidogyrus casuarinus]|uniref:Tether containing UBX domain for GLUT4 n=1 Tax=Cichlidogyrus casuarinus TaxID=1844966 RepID=A0ABD2QDY8_9PLAT
MTRCSMIPVVSLFSLRIVGLKSLEACPISYFGIRSNGVALSLTSTAASNDALEAEKNSSKSIHLFQKLSSIVLPTTHNEIASQEVDHIDEIYAEPAINPLIPDPRELKVTRVPYGIFEQAPKKSIFDNDAPVAASSSMQEKEKPKTLGELIGISLDRTETSTTSIGEDFSNFKFPEETAGLNLNTEVVEELNEDTGRIECDREICCFLKPKRVTRPDSNGQQLDDEDESIYEVTEQDMRLLLASLRKEADEEANLESAEIKQLSRERKIAEKYKRCLIRFEFERPDDFLIVQASFLPQERVSSLFVFVETVIRDCPKNFELCEYIFIGSILLNLSKL